ncbi:hypothetical protein BHE74_00051522 [Ensete ventricosum]|nr:hypothetical protein GW17_00050871 [Ensete ventricosum]RWW42881.1 hypothetical protein BHE74_00051522 [Ensete ventricosum]RZS05693.1 hypothetical protein BHM03_00036239 [Ensete ventricosum]
MGDLVLRRAEVSDGRDRTVSVISSSIQTGLQNPNFLLEPPSLGLEGLQLPSQLIDVPLQFFYIGLGGHDQILVGPTLEFLVGGPKRQNSLVLASDQPTNIMHPVDESSNKISPCDEKEKRKLRLKGGKKTKRMEEMALTQTADLLALFISSSEEHSYACFARVGCKAPCKYSLDSGPLVQNWLGLAIADHLDNFQSRHDSGEVPFYSHAVLHLTQLPEGITSFRSLLHLYRLFPLS